MEETRLCSVCKKSLPVSDFYVANKENGRLFTECKECCKARTRKNRNEKIDYYRNYDKIRASDERRVESTKKYRHSKKGLDAHQKRNAVYRSNNVEKYNAHKKVTAAINGGKLKRPSTCSVCGCGGKIEGHHEDYSRPLDVTWLCQSCHKLAHRHAAA